MDNFAQMSMLEIATNLMKQKRTPQPIRKLIKEVLEVKGHEDGTGQLAAQLYIDITTSSKFVYTGNEEWDLKIRQSLDEYDKDGAAFNTKEDLLEAEREISAVLPVDNFDDEDDDDSVIESTNEKVDDVETDVVDESEGELTFVENSNDDDEDDDEESELRYVDSEDEFMDEDKYNDYMDSYEDLYDE